MTLLLLAADAPTGVTEAIIALLGKLTPIDAILVVFTAVQWWFYRKDAKANVEVIQTQALTIQRLSDRVGVAKP